MNIAHTAYTDNTYAAAGRAAKAVGPAQPDQCRPAGNLVTEDADERGERSRDQ